MAAVSPRAEASAGEALSGRLARAAAWMSRESLLLIVFTLIATVWSLDLTGAVRADTWLTLLGGREITAYGIPRHDGLAILSHGREWIDQQWLAQVVFYELYRIGGMGLLLRLNLVLFMLPLGLAVWAGRRRGASPARVLLVAVPTLLLTGTFLRAQVLSQLLFVPLFLLLLRESRGPSRRVLLAFPILVLWANLHGAVVVGAALVGALGASELLREVRGSHRLARPIALLALPWLCVLATPYGLGTLAYYHATMHNPVLAHYVSEWMAPQLLSLWGLLFFPFAVFAVFLAGRRLSRLNAFELAALAITLAGGLLAVRSVIWFNYVCVVLVPALLEDVWPTRAPASLPRREHLFRVAAAAASLVLFLVVFAKPITTMKKQWPDSATQKVAQLLAADPNAKVLASEEYGDWLLFRVPQLRGRLAFDGRWEILTQAQLKDVMLYLINPNPWTERLDRGYRVIVLDPKQHRTLVAHLAKRPGVRRVFLDDRVVIFERLKTPAS